MDGFQVKKIIKDMLIPNGVLASNDEKTLFVSDSHLKLWRSYPIREDGTVGKGKIFLDSDTERKESPDGMTIEAQGNLYGSGRGGVWVASPKGETLGMIMVPESCSNVTFGDRDGKTLYMTCSKKVYSLQMTDRGGQYRK